MINNRFIIIVPCYNVADWLTINLSIIKHQSYNNFLCIVIDDNSTDNTEDVVARFANKNNGSQAKAYMAGIDFLESNNVLKDEDILVEVDGDDWLSSVFTLDYLNHVYQNANIWMSYGQYQLYPTAQLGGHYNMHLCSEDVQRQQPFAYSHLKTYKYWLFNKIDRQDLIDPETGTYYNITWDFVLCMPMVEMAGRERVYRCEDVLYILNRSETLNNEGKIRVADQKNIEYKIRTKPKYNKISA